MTNNLEFGLNIDQLLAQLNELTDTPYTSQQAYLFLLRRWGYFEVSIQETEENKKSEDDSSTITTQNTANLIQIENAYLIHDYGSCLKTSAGEYYPSYATTGRLLNAVKEIIYLLNQRGAKQLKFDGLAVAKRMAWIECKKYQIKVSDFTADIKTKLLQDRLSRLEYLRDIVYSYPNKQ
jgi:hypothetical protein